MEAANQLYQKALQLLSCKDYTEYELRQKLTQFYIMRISSKKEIREFNHVLDEIVEKIKHYGWLNDIDYACKYIKVCYQKGYGKNKIVYGLKTKGLEPQDINIAFVNSEIDNSFSYIKRIIDKKFKGKDLSDWKIKNRIKRYLYSKGFEYDDIQSVVKDEPF